MFLESFKVTGLAVTQIFFLGAIGYFLVKKNTFGEAGLEALSRLTIDITLPFLIFCELIRGFTFTFYARWWLFPLMSIAITLLGLGVGSIFLKFIRGREHKMQFLTLIAFQNSGYLPLALVASLLPQDQLGPMFIYLFLFLLGFNLLIFSLGVYMLASKKGDKFELKSIFNPPVLATLITLVLILFKLNRIPDFVYKPLKMMGECTLPLAMLVVGGNLAQIRLGRIDKKAIFLMSLAKLVILPGLGILLLLKFRLPYLIGLLILIQLAAPPATTPSVIIRHYKKDDLLISQGIFFGHILGLISLPVFLSLYFALVMVK